MHYALLLNHQEPAPGEIPQEEWAAAETAFDAYTRSLDAAGVLLAAEILAPSEMTTMVTLREGALKVQDGPFAEAKEMLGGVFIIEVPDLDAALAWAEKCPAAQYGVIEVRPVAHAVVDGKWQS